MTTFTREQLARITQKFSVVGEYYTDDERDLAAFALAMLDQNEALRRDKFQLGEERAAEWKRAEKAEAERDEANDERDDAVARWARRAREAEATVKDYFTVQAERDRLREELREAEKRMKAWGCPDFDFICLNCGRETPCITEADLRPGDPGVPCTFDLTYPQMIERLRHYEDRQRKAEAERDRLRAQLDSILANSDSLESGKLADAHAEIKRLREELAGAEKAEAACKELLQVQAERDRLREELREAEEAIRYVAHGDGYDCYRSESSPGPRGVVGYTGVGGVWFAFPEKMQPAVRRARERAGRG